MLVSIQFPIIDLRFALVAADAQQLKLPDFIRPRADNRFLHFHGGFIDDALCKAHHALRLSPSLSTQKIGKILQLTPQIYTFRFREGQTSQHTQPRRHPGRLLAAGEKGSVFLEVAFRDRAEELLREKTEQSSRELKALLEGYLDLPVQVPFANRPPGSLAEAGPYLARLYQMGTSRESRDSEPGEWVQAGAPVTLVKYIAFEGLRLPADTTLAFSLPGEGVSLSYSHARKNSRPVRIWWVGIDADRYASRDSRNTQHQLCQYLQAVHLQTEAVFALLDYLDALGPGQQVLRKQEVLATLNRTLIKLSKNSAYGFYQPALKSIVIDDPRWLDYQTKVAGTEDPDVIERYNRVAELLRLEVFLAEDNYPKARPILEYLVADDQVETAIEYLLSYCRRPGESYDEWRLELMQTQVRLKNLDKRFDAGKVSEPTYFTERNRITVELMRLMGRMGSGG